MSLSQLKQIVKDHKIKGVSNLNKKELTDLLTAREIPIPVKESKSKPVEVIEVVETPAVEIEVVPPVESVVEAPEVKQVDPKYERLKTIRKNPKQVRITDVTTNEVTTYKSLYPAGKALGHSSKM